jgi:hypothetical protein
MKLHKSSVTKKLNAYVRKNGHKGSRCTGIKIVPNQELSISYKPYGLQSDYTNNFWPYRTWAKYRGAHYSSAQCFITGSISAIKSLIKEV